MITPNVPEAEGLLGRDDLADEPDEDAARELVALGPRWVLLKGGHLTSEDAVDLLTDGDQVIRLEAKRIPTKHTHGTGCTLSAALDREPREGTRRPGRRARSEEVRDARDRASPVDRTRHRPGESGVGAVVSR